MQTFFFPALTTAPNWTVTPQTEITNGEYGYKIFHNYTLFSCTLHITYLIYYDLHFSASVLAKPKDSSGGKMTL